MILRKALGSLILALGIHFAAYYFLIRKIIIWTVFPGSSYFFKRNLELQYMNNMGNHVLEQIRDFRSCLDSFKTASNTDALERTQSLANTSASMRQIITSFSR